MFNTESIDCYGTGTIGEKGQIVIPAKAREKLKIKSGDEFIFFSHGPLMHIVRADQLNQMLDKMTQRFATRVKDIKKKFKAQIKK